jgi:hypothetical protein
LLFPVAVAGQRVIWTWPTADPASAARYVEAHRDPSDRVIGNDWTHAYYFHYLGAHFALAEKGVPPASSSRMWVVVTTGSDASREDRLQMAFHMTPRGWSSRPMAEFHLTTVVLATQP